MILKEFKENMETIISQSNSYLHWAGEFNKLCQAYKLGNIGQDVFAVVFCELENKLINEKYRQKVAKETLDNMTGSLKTPRKVVDNGSECY